MSTICHYLRGIGWRIFFSTRRFTSRFDIGIPRSLKYSKYSKDDEKEFSRDRWKAHFRLENDKSRPRQSASSSSKVSHFSRADFYFCANKSHRFKRNWATSSHVKQNNARSSLARKIRLFSSFLPSAFEKMLNHRCICRQREKRETTRYSTFRRTNADVHRVFSPIRVHPRTLF